MGLFRFCGSAVAIAAALLLAAYWHARAVTPEENGLRIATRWCAACHVVGPEQQRAGDSAPTFARIGRVNGFDRQKLVARLIAPHPPMPTLSLSDEEIDALVAYIQSLN